MAKPLYQVLASLCGAFQNVNLGLHNGSFQGDPDWMNKHRDRAEALVKEYLPSGSGFDSGTQIDVDGSNGESLRFTTAFHHMDEHGGYDGWTTHAVIVKPSLQFGFDLRITGKDRNDIKDYIAETFRHALGQEIDEKAFYAKRIAEEA